MKTYIILFSLAMKAAVSFAQDDDYNKTPYMTKSLSNDAINKVIVSTTGGGIFVSGKSGEQPRVEVYIRGNNDRELSKEEIEKRLAEDFELTVNVNGHELTAEAKTRHHIENWRNGLNISFKVYVPEQVSTELKTSGGGIHLDNLKGNENFSTSGGGLDLDKLSGVIHGRTSGGGIDVRNSSETIDLTTSGGGIEAKNCNGDIKLNTSGGGLELEDLKGTIDARTSGGGIEANNIEGELNTSSSGGSIDLRGMNCSLDASTSAGSLSVEMKQVGKFLRLGTSSGNIDLQLPAKQGLDLDLRGERVNQHQFNGFNGEWGKDHVKGTVNGGGNTVSASASNGDIDVKFN